MSKLRLFAAGLFLSSALCVCNQVQAQVPQQCVTNAVAGGTSDAITVPLLPCGLSTNILILTITANNTTTTPTLQMAGFPALPIYTNILAAPGIGDFGAAGSVLMLTSTGSSWLIINGNVGGFIPLPLSVANGGTGDATLTSHGVLYGNGTSAVGVTVAGITGQFLSGNTGAAPTWATGLSSWSAGTTGFTPSSPTGGAVVLAGTLIPANGGTGISSYTTGDLLYASSSSVLTALADIATGNAVISGGTSTAPSWGKIGLTTHVTGILPVANGGSGAATFTAHGLLVGEGTSAFAALATGTTGQLLVGVTGADPVWTSVPANGVTTIGFGTTGLTPSAATGGVVTVAGTLAVANGGTGQTSYTDGQLLIGNSSGNTLTKASLTAGTGISITPGNGSISIATTASGGNVPVTETSNFNAVAGTFTNPTVYAVNTTGGAVTATLDAAPANGATVLFLDKAQNFSIANLVLGRNSLTIMNSATNLTVGTNNANFHITYVSDSGTPTWIIW